MTTLPINPERKHPSKHIRRAEKRLAARVEKFNGKDGQGSGPQEFHLPGSLKHHN